MNCKAMYRSYCNYWSYVETSKLTRYRRSISWIGCRAMNIYGKHTYNGLYSESWSMKLHFSAINGTYKSRCNNTYDRL